MRTGNGDSGIMSDYTLKSVIKPRCEIFLFLERHIYVSLSSVESVILIFTKMTEGAKIQLQKFSIIDGVIVEFIFYTKLYILLTEASN